MEVVRQADDPFVCFGAKPDKGFGLEISTRPEVGRERESGLGQRNSEEAVGEGWREWPVDTGQQRDQSAWDRVQESVREEQSRWVSTPHGL